jgi:5'-nucleotidase / UDP-sugar diphosphatase
MLAPTFTPYSEPFRKGMMPINRIFIVAILCMVLLQGCAHVQETGKDEFELTIAHVNDTHSHLEPALTSLKINGETVSSELGGMARLKSALDDVRAKNVNVLFLHGGDMIQGTLYFAKYQGRADMDILNMLGIDVVSSGNHEFDEGPGMLAALMSMANFPIISSNIDVSKEPRLAGRLAPYFVKTVGGEKIGVIGITTTETPAISNPGPNVKFTDPAVSVMAAVSELRKMGIRKIILLSHLGYEEDIALAKKIVDVRIIVGGNSHTLLGNMAAFSSLGLTPEGAYPTIIKDRDNRDVLIVQAWEWAKVLGLLHVRFNADGTVVRWRGAPMLLVGATFHKDNRVVSEGSKEQSDILDSLRSSGVVGIYKEDEFVNARLKTYSEPLKAMMKQPLAHVSADLKRGNNTGPGPIVADSMLAKTRSAGVQISVQNCGGIRKDIAAGDITVAETYELLPFNNSLVILELKGVELIEALEEAVDFQMAGGNKAPYLYVAGMTFRVDEAAQKGARIKDVMIKASNDAYEPLETSKAYRIVTSSYLAGGGDGILTFRKAAGYRFDTGFIDAEVFMEYLKLKKTIESPAEKRISLAPHYNIRFAIVTPIEAFNNKQTYMLKAA